MSVVDIGNLVPSLVAIVERYWNTTIDACATRVTREWSDILGVFYRVYANRWYAVVPANDHERDFLEAMWRSQQVEWD